MMNEIERRAGPLPALACAIGLFVVPAVFAATTADISASLRARLAEGGPKATAPTRPPVDLARIYAARDYQPVWQSQSELSARIDQMRAVLGQAAAEGLDPGDYAPPATLGGAPPVSADELAARELELTGVLLAYASDLRTGRMAARDADPELFLHPGTADLSEVLTAAASSSDLPSYFRDFAPENPKYLRLRRTLAEYRQLESAGGWPRVPPGPKLELGTRDDRVASLRARLAVSQDISVDALEDQLFDAGLDEAVRRFQRRHGLEADGVVGPRTLAELNVPVSTRIEQLTLNMERWRWAPDRLGEKYVVVNLAAFELDFVDSGYTDLSMRVIVGRQYRRSPVFSDRVRYLEFNPTWTVPLKIARLDLLPKFRKEPEYVLKQRFRVFEGWQDGARELDPKTIDWNQFEASRFSLRLRQEPGPDNALGRVKFMFPNKHDVYLHDTPARELFTRTVRTFSSGCIRVERPLELAERLLVSDPKWSREAMEAVIATNKTTVVNLQQPVPVHITYSTAWVGEGGTVHFRDDIYGRDAILRKALFR